MPDKLIEAAQVQVVLRGGRNAQPLFNGPGHLERWQAMIPIHNPGDPEAFTPGLQRWTLGITVSGQELVRQVQRLEGNHPLTVQLGDGREGAVAIAAVREQEVELVGHGALELPPALAAERKARQHLAVFGPMMDRAELRDNPEVVKVVLADLAAAVRDFRRTLGQLPLAALDELIGHADAFGCFVDPTGWDRTRTNRKFNGELLEAARKFHTRVGNLMADASGCRPIHAAMAKGFPCAICGLPGEGEPEADATSAADEERRTVPAGREQEVQQDPPSQGPAC